MWSPPNTGIGNESKWSCVVPTRKHEHETRVRDHVRSRPKNMNKEMRASDHVQSPHENTNKKLDWATMCGPHRKTRTRRWEQATMCSPHKKTRTRNGSDWPCGSWCARGMGYRHVQCLQNWWSEKESFGMYPALDRYVMPDLLKCPSLPCHKDDTGRSTKKSLLSLRVTYSGYSECTLGPRARRRFPRWNVHPPKEKLAWMPTSSSCPTEISNRHRSGTWRTSCRASREIQFYRSNANYCTLLRISNTNRFEIPNRVAMELWPERSHVIGSTRVQEPTCWFLRSKQNVCFNDALHGEDVYILHSDLFRWRGRTTKVHLFGSVGVLYNSLSCHDIVMNKTLWSRFELATFLQKPLALTNALIIDW